MGVPGLALRFGKQINRETLSQFLRFAIVGVATNVTGFGVYLLITQTLFGPKLAMTILYVLGAGFGYLGNRAYSFKSKSNHRNSSVKYAMVHLSGYALNLLILTIFVDEFGVRHEFVQAVSIAIVAIYLFLLMKFFVFREETP